MLGLTLPQAAATLAATVIGFNIGLFDQSVVNAVLVLILVSIVAATRDRRAVQEATCRCRRSNGQRWASAILVALEDPGQAQIGFTIGARVAAPDGGIVRGLLGAAPPKSAPAKRPSRNCVASATRMESGHRPHCSAQLVRRGNRQRRRRARALVRAGRANAARLPLPLLGGPGEAVAASITTPVAIVIGEAEKIREVVLLDGQPSDDGPANGAVEIAGELATRIGGKNVKVHPAGDPNAVRQSRAGTAGHRADLILAGARRRGPAGGSGTHHGARPAATPRRQRSLAVLDPRRPNLTCPA